MLFLHRFYVENITQLKDIITVELFFLNVKSAVYNVSSFLLNVWGLKWWYMIDFIKGVFVLFFPHLVIHCLWTLAAPQLSRQCLQGTFFFFLSLLAWISKKQPQKVEKNTSPFREQVEATVGGHVEVLYLDLESCLLFMCLFFPFISPSGDYRSGKWERLQISCECTAGQCFYIHRSYPC